MRKIIKLYVASLLAVSLGVATVICCCIAPAVMAQFHRQAVCSQCLDHDSSGKSSSPLGACQQQLTSADFLQGLTVSVPAVSSQHFHSPDFLNNYQITLTHSIVLAYPPGGPPLGISLTPLYLRTFNLRI